MEEAAASLAEALSQLDALHLPGARALHRERLGRALELSGRVLAEGGDGAALDEARRTAARAHAARAKDARHGVGQLSQASQRAPTEADCEDGWRKVAAIVETAEASAREARALARALPEPALEEAAATADAAAKEARRILGARNRAYTFHTDPGFSFGEGWYVAAAGVLAGITIQVQPEQPQSAAAERFLRDAGLEAQLVPYRSRPRANKALPALVADAFAADGASAAQRLRAAFLGDAPLSRDVVAWADGQLAGSPAGPKVLVWVRRDTTHQPERHSTAEEVQAVCALVRGHGATPVLFGDAMPEVQNGLDLTLCWRRPLFAGLHARRAQLQLVEHLRRAHGLVGQVGVTTAGMDGHALMGLPTQYVTQHPNDRLGRWVGVVPGYEEVVRAPGYLPRIGSRIGSWIDVSGA